MPTNDKCLMCKHFWGLTSCNAFPNGIPDEILLTGNNAHKKPLKGQNGKFVFTQMNPKGRIVGRFIPE